MKGVSQNRETEDNATLCIAVYQATLISCSLMTRGHHSRLLHMQSWQSFMLDLLSDAIQKENCLLSECVNLHTMGPLILVYLFKHSLMYGHGQDDLP